MNPRERLLRAMRGQPVDRVPLVLPHCQLASADGLAEIQDPLRRRLAERTFGRMHFDVGVPACVNRYLVTPPQRIRSEAADVPDGRRRRLGTIDTPKGELTFVTEWNRQSAQTTWTVKYPCETYDDIRKIASVPWERPANLAPPALDRLPDAFADRGIVRTGVSSPFVCVAGMMRYERFLELCATDLGLMKELTEICRQRIVDVLSVLFARPGIEYVWMGGSEWVTAPMASPRIYDALVQEQERSIIDFVHSQPLPDALPEVPDLREGSTGDAAHPIVHVHCHGRVRHALARTIERGADYTEPVEPPPDGDITMAEAKALAAGRITLGGNIEARVLCNETERAVRAAVHAAFEGGADRFVLAPTEGPSPTLGHREFRNWMAMVDAWEELSPIGAATRRDA